MDLGCSDGNFVWHPQPGCAMGEVRRENPSGSWFLRPGNFYGRSFVSCDLSEFDLGVCCSFWLGCGHIGGKVRSQQGVSQFCTLVSREGIQTGQRVGRGGI